MSQKRFSITKKNKGRALGNPEALIIQRLSLLAFSAFLAALALALAS